VSMTRSSESKKLGGDQNSTRYLLRSGLTQCAAFNHNCDDGEEREGSGGCNPYKGNGVAETNHVRGLGMVLILVALLV